MKQNKLLIIITLLIAFTTTSLAQTRTVTLDECVDLALENNIKVHAAMLAVQQAEQRKKEMFTSFFPSISLAAGAYTMNRYIIDFELFDIPILQYIRTGNFATASAIQPIFTGGQLMNGNKLARVGVEVSRLQQQKSSDEVRLTTEQYYWDIVVLKAKMQTVNALDTMLTKLLADVTTAVRVGVKMQNDLLQVQLKQNEVEADRLKITHGLQTSQLLLEQFIGEENINISQEIDFDNLPTFPFDAKKDHLTALLATNDYQLLEKNVRAQTLNKRLEVGKHLPQLAIGGALTTHNIIDGRQNLASVFATVSVPLTDWWGGSHAIKRLKYAEELAREELDDNSKLLLIAMENCWNSVEEAYNQLCLSQKSITQARENLRLNDTYYHAGTIPLSELLEAQSLYQQATGNFAQAYADFYMALSQYKIATASSD